MTKDEAVSIIEDRVRVTEYVESSYVDCVDIEALKMAIEALRQPEIVRCKDCANCSRDAVFDDYWCDGREVEANHYCGYAERREE